eukprot:5446962-Alexandrium_andersonii.AAC.1
MRRTTNDRAGSWRTGAVIRRRERIGLVHNSQRIELLQCANVRRVLIGRRKTRILEARPLAIPGVAFARKYGEERPLPS